MAETKTNPLSFVTFLDIESVPEAEVKQLPYDKMMLFDKKYRRDIEALGMTDDFDAQTANWSLNLAKVWSEKAALHAEFGKIVCISVGKLHTNGIFYIKSFCGRDEKKLLIQLAEALTTAAMLCAHNGKEFDFPFLIRRYIIHGLPIPQILQTFGKKPWELQLEDTMELWSATQWKYRCSLELLAHVLGLPSPKQDMDGAQVAKLYYSMFPEGKTEDLPWEKEEEVLTKISNYCNGDVFTLANVFARIKGYDTIASFEVIPANPPTTTANG